MVGPSCSFITIIFRSMMYIKTQTLCAIVTKNCLIIGTKPLPSLLSRTNKVSKELQEALVTKNTKKDPNNEIDILVHDTTP